MKLRRSDLGEGIGESLVVVNKRSSATVSGAAAMSFLVDVLRLPLSISSLVS